MEAFLWIIIPIILKPAVITASHKQVVVHPATKQILVLPFQRQNIADAETMEPAVAVKVPLGLLGLLDQLGRGVRLALPEPLALLD